MGNIISGAVALAQGAIESGISLVTGYPGAPATSVFNAIEDLSPDGQVRLEWTANEKSAIEIAFGASVAGMRSLLCLKSVGLNIALDPLMSMVLSGCNAGLVILAGDDPGGWGSQNEQDSRMLALAAELPIIEPAKVRDARNAMREAFALSEKLSLPVMVRTTRAFAYATAELEGNDFCTHSTKAPSSFEREYMRWVVLPVNVVPYHERHLKKLTKLAAFFEASDMNETIGDGQVGIICAGFLLQKLLDLFEAELPTELKVMSLTTIHPLPKRAVQQFLQSVEYVLVLEETAPVIEGAVRDAAQEIGLVTPIYGRVSGHVASVGELLHPQISAALRNLRVEFEVPNSGAVERDRPSLVPLCEGCPYIPTFEVLLNVMEEDGGRDQFVVTGDPGCMVRAQPSPYELMDVKNSLGSGIGMGAGLALALAQSGDERRVIALCGDSGLIHSGFQGLVDAVQLGVRMLVLILDNGTTALSGGQPHPGSTVNVQGGPRNRVDLGDIVRAAGVEYCTIVDLDRGEDIRSAIKTGLVDDNLHVIIAKGECIFY